MKDPASGVKQPVTLHWMKPPLGHFKLNVDGSRSDTGVIGAGGIIRKRSGDWIQGISHHIGDGEVLQC